MAYRTPRRRSGAKLPALAGLHLTCERQGITDELADRFTNDDRRGDGDVDLRPESRFARRATLIMRPAIGSAQCRPLLLAGRTRRTRKSRPGPGIPSRAHK